MIQRTTEQLGKEMRAVYRETLMALMDAHSDIVVCDADLVGASGSAALFKSHPERCVNMGISEANMMGAAAGMSLMGKVPYVHTFAPFATRRVYDQLYVSGAYQQANIRIYGSDPGFWAAHNGGTHTSVEDFALMTAMPGMHVLAPSDAAQFSWMLKETAGRRGMFYMRAPRKVLPDLYTRDSAFEWGKGIVLNAGTDAVIFAIGDMVSEALEAQKALAAQGLSVAVVDIFSLKPLDVELIQRVSRDKRCVVTAENHSVYGGLGSLVAMALMQSGIQVPFRAVAIADRFGEVGTVDYLRALYGLTAQNIVEAVLSSLQTL